MQRKDAIAKVAKVSEYQAVVSKMWEDMTVYRSDSVLRPDFYLCVGAKLMDISSNMDFEHVQMLMEVEMSLLEPDDEIILVAARNTL